MLSSVSVTVSQCSMQGRRPKQEDRYIVVDDLVLHTFLKRCPAPPTNITSPETNNEVIKGAACGIGWKDSGHTTGVQRKLQSDEQEKVENVRRKIGCSPVSLYGLFDGHQGRLASDWCAENLPSQLFTDIFKALTTSPMTTNSTTKSATTTSETVHTASSSTGRKEDSSSSSTVRVSSGDDSYSSMSWQANNLFSYYSLPSCSLLPSFCYSLPTVISNTFLKVDNSFLQKYRVSKDGCTAVLFLRIGDIGLVAGLGDSRAVLGCVGTWTNMDGILVKTMETNIDNQKNTGEEVVAEQVQNKLSTDLLNKGRSPKTSETSDDHCLVDLQGEKTFGCTTLVDDGITEQAEEKADPPPNVDSPETSGVPESVEEKSHETNIDKIVMEKTDVNSKKRPRYDLQDCRLTTDHKPDLPEERKRIQNNNGVVLKIGGIARVGPGDYEARIKRIKFDICTTGGSAEKPPVLLAVSRAFGDRELKLPPNRLISAVPTIIMFKLCMDFKFICMACDGVWDVLSDQEVVDIIGSWTGPREEASSAVIKAAYQRGSQDNLTAIILFLDSD